MVHKPSIGRIVHYYQGDNEAAQAQFPRGAAQTWREWEDRIAEEGPTAKGTNGTRFHPAMITRVWSDDCVNLLVFLDAKGTEVKSSATRLPAEMFVDGIHCVNSGWIWPERVA